MIPASNRAQNHRVEIILDRSVAADVEELRLLKKPGKFRFRGFTFDLFNRPAENREQGEKRVMARKKKA